MIRSTFSGLSTALTAIQANQKRLDIIGQNLANMNTVGYTRQQLETSSLNYSGPVGHYMNGSATVVGFGVSMNKVSQIRDPYLDVQYRAQMSKASYTDSMQTSLDSLADILDESNISGISDTLNEIQSVLTSGMQDPAKVNDPVYESELRSRMQSLTNLLNDSARQIDTAQKNEFDRLNGEGTSEQGAVQRVNEILRQVGDLNIQIKQNQILGQQSLELMDERNVLLDELAGYLPIEVSYYKNAEHSGTYDYPITDADGRPVTDGNGNPVTEKRDRMYEYDSKGKVIGRRDWPDDLKVTLNYTDKNGASKQLTLVEGTEGGKGNNYGSLELTGGSREEPLLAAVTITAATSAGGSSTVVSASERQLRDGSIQASLDMLGKIGTGELIAGTATLDDVRGYQFYMKKLDALAQTFAGIINDINQKGVQGSPQVNDTPYLLLANKTTDTGDGIMAANIGISTDWINGNAHVGMLGDSPTDTVLNMLEAMSKAHAGLGNKSFASYMNNTSTILANDSRANQNILKTNVTVLNSIQDYKDSVSGISMDEEASNMMAYMSAYNAASRLMTAMDEALNTLINNTGLVGR